MVQEEAGLNTKTDKSLVTTADYASQAVIYLCALRSAAARIAHSHCPRLLVEAFGEGVQLVGEEDSVSLAGPEGAELLGRVTAEVNAALQSAGRAPVSPERVLAAVDSGASSGGRTGRQWVLDPVDGTLGFVRGDQYAVALALLVDGQLVLGVLGCPNMPTRPDVLESGGAGGALSYGFSPRLLSKMLAGATGPGAWYRGVIFAAVRGGGTWMHACDESLGCSPLRAHVSLNEDARLARLTEPVLKANSSHGFSADVATRVGLGQRPLRLYSMVKYGAVARGDADVFLKFPKAGYKEKIWDHAAGVIVVEEAGGVVTDAGGRVSTRLLSLLCLPLTRPAVRHLTSAPAGSWSTWTGGYWPPAGRCMGDS
jgi:3'(2'), 5'-bisphosphate nucleotidase